MHFPFTPRSAIHRWLKVSVLLAFSSLFLSVQANILDNGNFDSGFGSWEIDQESGRFLTIEKDASGDGSYILYDQRSDPDVAVSFNQALNFDKEKKVTVSFEYFSDTAPLLLVWQGKKGKTTHQVELSASNGWTAYSFNLSVSKDKGPYKLDFLPGAAPPYTVSGRSLNPSIAAKTGFRNIRVVEKSEDTTIAPIDEEPEPKFTYTAETIVHKTVGDHELDSILWMPESVTGPVPIILWVHGGGWGSGSPVGNEFRARFLIERGIAVFSVRYRLRKHGGVLSDSRQDVLDAMEWVRQNKDKYNFDLNRVGLAGSSAGANLSSSCAQLIPEANLYIGFSGLYDLHDVGDGRFGQPSNGVFLDDRNAASAAHNIKDNPPATFLLPDPHS
ncbi:MAG: alpha/beta hydrolase [Verrucomicrobiota bacterium]